MDMEGIESAMILGEEDISKDEESKDSTDEDDDNHHENLRCKNCSKLYRIKSWFLKHCYLYSRVIRNTNYPVTRVLTTRADN